MTALAVAAVIVALLAFVDRVLTRRATAQQKTLRNEFIDKQDAATWSDMDERVRALEGLADRVSDLEKAPAPVELPVIPDYEALETKYNAIITNGINEMRELLAPLRKSILKAVPK